MSASDNVCWPHRHVLPTVVSLMAKKELNPTQFATFVGRARAMLDGVIADRNKQFERDGLAVQGVEVAQARPFPF